MKKLISNLFRKETIKKESFFSQNVCKNKVTTAAKKEMSLKVVGERYGRAITRLSDT